MSNVQVEGTAKKMILQMMHAKHAPQVKWKVAEVTENRRNPPVTQTVLLVTIVHLGPKLLRFNAQKGIIAPLEAKPALPENAMQGITALRNQVVATMKTNNVLLDIIVLKDRGESMVKALVMPARKPAHVDTCVPGDLHLVLNKNAKIVIRSPPE